MIEKQRDSQAEMPPLAKVQNGPDFYTTDNGVLVFTNPLIVNALLQNPTHKSALIALVSVGKAEIPKEVIL